MLAGNAAYEPPPVTDFVLLQSYELPSSQANFSFSNLSSTYGSTYRHLQIRTMTKLDNSNTNLGGMQIAFNDNSVGGESRAALTSSNASTTITTTDIGTATPIKFNDLVPKIESATTDYFAPAIIDIPDAFETAKYKTVKVLAYAYSSTESYVQLASGVWGSANAIDTITLDTVGPNDWYVGSTFALYGMAV